MCILWNKSVSIQQPYPFDPGVLPFIKIPLTVKFKIFNSKHSVLTIETIIRQANTTLKTNPILFLGPGMGGKVSKKSESLLNYFTGQLLIS